jgi:hypothetical protein
MSTPFSLNEKTTRSCSEQAFVAFLTNRKKKFATMDMTPSSPLQASAKRFKWKYQYKPVSGIDIHNSDNMKKCY